MESFIVFLIYGIICGGFCCFLAETKNRDTVMWFLSGFFFGVIALFVIGVVAPLEKKVAFEEKGKF